MRDFFKHTVFFWLKEPNNPSKKEAFETSLNKFIDSSEYIQTKHIGTPASTNRGVIDSSYTYCLSLGFSSKEKQDKYQDEPAHKVFIEESSGLWGRVVVYDSISI